MSIYEMAFGGSGVFLIVLTLIQVSPIEINPWGAIGRAIGRFINQELMDNVAKIDGDLQEMKNELQKVKNDIAEQRAVDCRTNILQFGDEVIHDTSHTKERFDQVLYDITVYERYCKAHPDFVNNMTELTSKRIKDIYLQCLEKSSFL